MLVAGHNPVVIMCDPSNEVCRDEACLVRAENGIMADRAGPVPTPNHVIMCPCQHAALKMIALQNHGCMEAKMLIYRIGTALRSPWRVSV